MSINAPKVITAKKFMVMNAAAMDISYYGLEPMWTLMFMSITAKW